MKRLGAALLLLWPGAQVHFAGTLLLAMGLAGLLSVALIVTADQSNAGVDGMRAIRALVPLAELDPLPGTGRLTDVPPALAGAAPASVAAATPTPTPVPPAAAGLPAPAPNAAATPPPASQTPAGTPPAAPTATPPPTATLAPSATPAPSPSPTPLPPVAPPPPAPTDTPSPSPTASVAVSTDHGATALVGVSALVPGDSVQRPLAVRNTGTLRFSYVIQLTQTAATALWTDSTDGLQLSITTTGGSVLYSGALSQLGTLAGPSLLDPGASETLTYTFALPQSAPNALQGLQQDLAIVITATQAP